MQAETDSAGRPEERSNAWRRALITTVVAVAFNPVSLLVGYYLSKTLASPKLSVQYTTAAVELAPFRLDKASPSSITIRRAVNSLSVYLPYLLFDPSWTQCFSEYESSRSLSVNCVNQFRRALEQFGEQLDFEKGRVTRNIAAINTWNGETELSLTPLILPTLKEPLEVTARHDKRDAISILRNYENSLGESRSAVTTLLQTFNDFASSPLKRTGKITFQVGVLNSGDSDGVIFPSATLSFHNSHIMLRTVDATTDSSTNAFNVVRAHSFNEIAFAVDDAVTSPSALSNWSALVKGGAQEEFTIELKSSSATISGKDRLPP